MRIYINSERNLVLPGRWTWTREHKTALDEFHGEAGAAGLFTVDGWCIIGVYRRRTRLHWTGLYLYGRIGIILFNTFYGFWQDSDAEQYRP